MLKYLIFSLTLTGTLVGAGFATGQEILSFFVIHNPNNPLYFLASAFVIFLCVYVISRRKEKSAQELFYYLFGYPLGRVINFVSLISLFICYGASLSGMGSIFFESFSLPYLCGAVVMTVISFSACIYGTKGINMLNSVLTPFIIFSVIIFGSLSATHPAGELITFKNTGPLPLIYSFLYAGYNIFPLIPIALSGEKAKGGVWLAFVFTALCGTAMYYSLTRNPEAAFSSQIPFENIIRNLFPVVSFLYSLAVSAALVTTGASCLYGFTSALEEKFRKLPLFIFCLLISAVFLFFGLSGTVRIFYPISGIAGTFLILRILLLAVFGK